MLPAPAYLFLPAGPDFAFEIILFRSSILQLYFFYFFNFLSWLRDQYVHSECWVLPLTVTFYIVSVGRFGLRSLGRELVMSISLQPAA